MPALTEALFSQMPGSFLDLRKMEEAKRVERNGASESNSGLGSIYLIFEETLRY